MDSRQMVYIEIESEWSNCFRRILTKIYLKLLFPIISWRISSDFIDSFVRVRHIFSAYFNFFLLSQDTVNVLRLGPDYMSRAGPVISRAASVWAGPVVM